MKKNYKILTHFGNALCELHVICLHVVVQVYNGVTSPWATYQARGHSNSNHVQFTLATLIIMKFPTIIEVPKWFPSENRCILDVHHIDERNYSINYLFNMTKRRFLMSHYHVL